MKKLELKTNGRNCLDLNLRLPSGAVLLLTAPLQDDYWWNEVALGNELTLKIVPQFGGCDIQLASRGKAVFTLPGEMNPAKLESWQRLALPFTAMRLD
jgi:hypothetical protein